MGHPGNDGGENAGGDIVVPTCGVVMFPIDCSFTTDELDCHDATPRACDGVDMVIDLAAVSS